MLKSIKTKNTPKLPKTSILPHFHHPFPFHSLISSTIDKRLIQRSTFKIMKDSDPRSSRLHQSNFILWIPSFSHLTI